MTDRNWAAFLELEERALKNLQGHKHCFGEDGRLAEGVKGEIHNRFEKLSHEERKKLTDAIQRWMDSIFAKDRSDEAAETVKDYTGSPGDDDVHGEIDESRATLEDYLDAHKQRLGSTKEARDATAELMRVRGEEEDAVTEYIKKMLEDHDTTIRDLEELLNQVDDLKGSARRKLERRRRIALGLPGEQWHYMKKLGTGSYGRAGVYVKLDETGTIVDRLVMKDSHFSDSPEDWKDPALWTGPDNNIPTEVQSLYNLRGKIGSHSIIQIRGWRIRREKIMHRIFMEYCPLGDLRDLILADKSVYGAQDERWEDRERDVSKNAEMLPEAFAWHLLETLCVAGLLMERGELEKDGMLRWDTIVHRDIKLPNVFLGTDSEDHYLGYPQPKLGDFGVAVFVPDNNTRDATSIRELGSWFKMAPEQHHMLQNEDGSVVPLGSKTNVWGVGAVMWMLLMCEDDIVPIPVEEAKKLTPKRYKVRKHFEPKAFDASAQAKYSKELQDVIMQCLAYEPSKRPTFDEIHKVIRINTTGKDNNLAQGLRSERNLERFSQAETKLNLEFMGVTTRDLWVMGKVLEVSGAFPEGKDDYPSPLPADRMDSANDTEYIDTFAGGHIEPSGDTLSPTDPPEKPAQAGAGERDGPRTRHGGKRGEKRKNDGDAEPRETRPKRAKTGEVHQTREEVPAAPDKDHGGEVETNPEPTRPTSVRPAKSKGKQKASELLGGGEESGSADRPIGTRAKPRVGKGKEKAPGPGIAAADGDHEGDDDENQESESKPKRRSARNKPTAEEPAVTGGAATTAPQVTKTSKGKKSTAKAKTSAPKSGKAPAKGKKSEPKKGKSTGAAKGAKSRPTAASASRTCAGQTNNGAKCKRTIKTGTYCHQHRPT